MVAEPSTPSPRFVFVGERRSRRAVQMGVCWRDGRLAARTLFAALRAAGIEPAEHHFVNAYLDDGTVDQRTLRRVRHWQRRGLVIVAMGQRAQRAVASAGIEYVPLIHPAARGAIRRLASYQAHVAAVLGGQS